MLHLGTEDTPECGDAAVEDGAAKSGELGSSSSASRRGSRKKRRPKPPRVIPTVRVYIGTFVHSTVDEPLVIMDRWMIGVDAGKVGGLRLSSLQHILIQLHACRRIQPVAAILWGSWDSDPSLSGSVGVQVCTDPHF